MLAATATAALPAVAAWSGNAGTGNAGSGDAGPMCQGRRATIVGGSDVRELRGTARADVIVTRGAFQVDAGRGADRICVTGTNDRKAWTVVSSGPGADRVVVTTSRIARIAVRLDDGDDRMVVASSRPARISADLGRGEDVYRGGSGRDTVHAVDGNPAQTVPEERDRISTGGGADDVDVGEYLQATHDAVGLGPGDDELSVRGVLAPAVRPEAGGGVDRLWLEPDRCFADESDPRCAQPPSASDWVIDNAEEVATVDGVLQSRWSGFEAFELFWLTRDGSLTFAGSAADESVRAPEDLLGAAMGGGDDSLRLAGPPVRQQQEISGGPGRDDIFVDGWQLTVDMAAGVMWEALTGSADDPDARFVEFEDAGGSGGDYVVVTGDGGDNDLLAVGCFATVRGGAGDDRLRTLPQTRMDGCDYYWPGVDFAGGPGADVLLGGWGPDRLDGGEGEDVADGSRDTDVCLAEVRRSCER